ncbi:MAG: hypothetical protein NT171_18580 [Planctomycetota bacterium]|nr:hypothetical protein [Planctomycetota bacterium]
MNPTINFPDSDAAVVAILIGLFGIVASIFWMVVAWRAMKAHEKLSAAAEEIARRHK